jgi:RecA/RadA recombinase
MAKAGIKKLADLRAEKHLGTPRKIYSVPFRSDVLNLFTGGVKFGHVTEISGNPGMFKSTILAEVAIHGLDNGAHVVVHDKERKLTESRFLSLGCKIANKSNPKFWYHEDDFPDYVLTLERMFEDMHEIWAGVRLDDLEQLQKKFTDGKATKVQQSRYEHLVPKPKKENKKSMASWQKKVADKLKSPAQLDDEDKTPIIWIVDSVTATPNADEAIDPTTGKPNLKPTMAKNARVWSDLFRTCGFLDAKVAALHIAQIRTAGIGSPRGAYKKAAVPTANEFYATNRIKIFPRSGGSLYRDPDEPESISIGSKVGKEEKIFQVGSIIMASIDKNLEGVSTNVPLYMLASTGTDVINSLFEFLSLRNLIATKGGYYAFDDKFWPERGGQTFRRGEFTQIYLEAGAEMLKKLVTWKELIQHGRLTDGADKSGQTDVPAGPR